VVGEACGDSGALPVCGCLMGLSLAGNGALTGVDLDALSASGRLPSGLLPAGSTLQMVQTVKTDVFTTASATFTTVTGLTAAITPTTNTSKVLVIAQLTVGGKDTSVDGGMGFWKVTRGGTDVYIGDQVGTTRVRAVFGGFMGATMSSATFSHSIMFLDSPATDVETTYQVEVRRGAGGTAFLNRSEGFGDSLSSVCGASSITVIEVAA